jgi:HAD superfamily hydrolase (TIGR01549 family)
MSLSKDKIKAVTFDAYGTLLHLDRPFERLSEELRGIGLDVPMDVVAKVFVREMHQYRERHLAGNNPQNLLKLRHECADFLFRLLAQEGYSAGVSKNRQLEVLVRAIRFKLYEDALPVLDWCLSQGLATGVISNWDCSLGDTLNALCHYKFSCMLVSACEGLEKPDSELFLRASSCFNLPASRIVHIGDEVENDFYGAARAGFQTILLDREGTGGQPDGNRIRNLKELPELFQRVFA